MVCKFEYFLCCKAVNSKIYWIISKTWVTARKKCIFTCFFISKITSKDAIRASEGVVGTGNQPDVVQN